MIASSGVVDEIEANAVDDVDERDRERDADEGA